MAAEVYRASQLIEPGSGGRWHEKVAPPDTAVVGAVRFYSGIE
jgi:hypothetical protein